jgi:hypothetical protein
VILGILVHESPNQNYGCEDMAKRSCDDLFVISGKWLGLI